MYECMPTLGGHKSKPTLERHKNKPQMAYFCVALAAMFCVSRVRIKLANQKNEKAGQRKDHKNKPQKAYVCVAFASEAIFFCKLIFAL